MWLLYFACFLHSAFCVRKVAGRYPNLVQNLPDTLLCLCTGFSFTAFIFSRISLLLYSTSPCRNKCLPLIFVWGNLLALSVVPFTISDRKPTLKKEREREEMIFSLFSELFRWKHWCCFCNFSMKMKFAFLWCIGMCLCPDTGINYLMISYCIIKYWLVTLSRFKSYEETPFMPYQVLCEGLNSW